MSPLYKFEVAKFNGTKVALSTLKGRVLLIVNTASQCGFTPQYKDLQVLHEKFSDQGFQILAFPCNQFGNQEPQSDSEIHTFCTKEFHIQFPLFEKVDVNGERTHPLFTFLKKRGKGILGTESIKWNFTKFLVSRDGQTVLRFSPHTSPKKLEGYIKKFLEAKS